jgi:hypothetical protein
MVTWTENDKSGVAGIDFAAVDVQAFERPKLGQTLIAVWAGVHPEHWDNGEAAGTSSDLHPLHCEDGGANGPGEFRGYSIMANDVPGQRLEFHVTFHRDDPGTLTLCDRQYDLAAGTLFLVSFAKKPPLVKQLKRNLSDGQLTAAALKQLATSDSEINHFFKDPNRK